jgi:hypothetical protein
MDDDFDELMGPPPVAMKSRLAVEPVVVSPLISPSSASASSARSSGSRRPPTGAFGNSAGPPTTAFSASTPDRWTQYEKDEQKLKEDATNASATAIAAAANRVAQRQMDSHVYSPEASPSPSRGMNHLDVNERLSRSGSSLPHSDEKKGFSFTSRGRNKKAEETPSYSSDADRVRAEAMKVLEMAGGDKDSPYSLRRTKSGGYSTESYKGKRSPAALAGLGLSNPNNAAKNTANRRAQEDRRFTIESDSENEFDGDLVDIINMERRAASARSIDAKSPRINDDSDKKSWSSRYSVDSRLMNTNSGQGNDSNQKILDDMDDQERQRLRISARNMSWSSPHGDRSNGSSPSIFANAFAFKGNIFSSGTKSLETPTKTTNLQTVWMDVDLQRNGNSLPSPTPSTKSRGPASLEKARKRRRVCIAIAVAVCFIAILAGVFGAKGDEIVNGANSASTAGDKDAVTFYVTADVPYDMGGENKLQRDLISLASDADFVVHLGNIQDASVTLCPETSYFNANAVLKTSPVPVFVLPGPDDWNNCPNPSTALDNWRTYLGRFEQNFNPDFVVDRQLGHEENFSFLANGVLFLGIHLVGGRVDNKDDWRVRHAMDVQWVEQKLASLNNADFRAVVILANARPSHQQEDFFSEVLDDIQGSGKPVLYVHANQGNGYDSETYVPYANTANLIALQIRDGGISPPMRVSVGQGRRPFSFDMS